MRLALTLRCLSLGLLASVVVSAVACSGGSAPRTSSTPAAGATDGTVAVNGSPAAGSPVAATAVPPSATTGGFTPTAASTATIASSGLLTVKDLPAGWVAGELQAPLLTTAVCNKSYGLAQGTAQVRAVLGYHQAGIFQMITTFATVAEAQAAVEELRATFASCVEWSKVLGSNRLATYRPSTLDQFPATGDQSLAWQVELAVSPPRVTGTNYLVIARRASAVMVLSYLAPGVGDPFQFQTFVKLADTKFQAAVARLAGPR